MIIAFASSFSCTLHPKSSAIYLIPHLEHSTSHTVQFDAMVLTLFHIAQFHITEICHGWCGLGNYNLYASMPQFPLSTFTNTAVMFSYEIVESTWNGHLLHHLHCEQSNIVGIVIRNHQHTSGLASDLTVDDALATTDGSWACLQCH